MDQNSKFYNRDWFMWLMLFFIAPVGIYLMWKRNKFNKKTRTILSVVFGIFFIITMIGSKIDEANTKAYNKREAIRIQEEKKAAEEKKKQEELLKPSKFEGITVGQENKLKEFIMAEAKKSIKKDGTFSDNWKIFKEGKKGDLFTLMFSYITKERSVEVENKFVATLTWDGSSENLKLRRINSNPVIMLSNDHIVRLQSLSKETVKANLKAPSTAKFPGGLFGVNDWGFGATFKGASKGSVLYQVQSYVDAQNSFGAMLRNNFNLVIEINWDTNKYTIKSIDIN